jgi:hypothetical protein
MAFGFLSLTPEKKIRKNHKGTYLRNIDVGYLFNYLCADMLRKYIYIVITGLLLVGQVNAQIKQGVSNPNRQLGSDLGSNPDSKKKSKDEAKKKKSKIPSRIKTWEVHEQGSLIQKS